MPKEVIAMLRRIRSRRLLYALALVIAAGCTSAPYELPCNPLEGDVCGYGRPTPSDTLQYNRLGRFWI